jgi:uncharacterized protein
VTSGREDAGLIIADTGAVVSLLDRDDRHHAYFRSLFEANPDRWVLPWAILPEVDHLVRRHVSHQTAELFMSDIAAARFLVEWGEAADVARAAELDSGYRDLQLGLVDGVVMSVAERLRASAIATLDERDFGAVRLARPVRLFPRDDPQPTLRP